MAPRRATAWLIMNHSARLCRRMPTASPALTPRSARVVAKPFARASSSPKVIRRAPSIRAIRSGSLAALAAIPRRCEPICPFTSNPSLGAGPADRAELLGDRLHGHLLPVPDLDDLLGPPLS